MHDMQATLSVNIPLVVLMPTADVCAVGPSDTCDSCGLLIASARQIAFPGCWLCDTCERVVVGGDCE